jgi:two-component system response regulator ChvI
MAPAATDPTSAMTQRRLIVVDDDRLFLSVFAANLQAGGYHPVCFEDAEAALAALKSGETACACVLDLDMPRLDGLAFLRALREAGIVVPVVFVTSHSAPLFEEQALRDGAVDFIDKSRGPAIILHRLDLATRRHGGRAGSPTATAAADLQRGRLTLRCQSRRALWDGVEVPLTRTEFEVVLRLASAAGDDVSYRDLYDVIKGEGFVAGPGEDGYRANVRSMIKRIRRKFEEIDAHFAALGTYPGFGYRWRDDG